MGGAGGHMWHPFDCPDVNSGQDLISFFQRSIESIKRNPAALKIDGVNLSFRLKENRGFPSGYEFVIDRGSMKPLDVAGVTAANADQRFMTKDGSPHGMVEATRILLGIFNAAIPEILPELKQIGMTQQYDENTGEGGHFGLYFNTEFVLKKINVKEYPFNFIAIHGVNKFMPKGPKSRKGVSVEVDQAILDQIKDKVQAFANESDFRVYTSIPTNVKKEVLLADALNEEFTIVYKSFATDPEEPGELGAGEGSTKPMKVWLADVRDNPVDKKVNISQEMRNIYPSMGKTQTPYAKNIYLEVLKGNAISNIAEGPADVEAIVDAVVVMHGTRLLGNAVLDALESDEFGSAREQEGVVISDPEICGGTSFKFTGDFIVGGLIGSAFNEAKFKKGELLKEFVVREEEEEEEQQNKDKFVILIPGGFKPPTGGHYHMIKHYDERPDTHKILVVTGPKPREGITLQQSKEIFNVYGGFSDKIDFITSDDPTPLRTCYELIQNENFVNQFPNMKFAVGAGDKGEDPKRIKQFVNYFMKDDNLKTKVSWYPPAKSLEVGGKPASASRMRKAYQQQNWEEFKDMLPNDNFYDDVVQVLNDQSSGDLGKITRVAENFLLAAPPSFLVETKTRAAKIGVDLVIEAPGDALVAGAQRTELTKQDIFNKLAEKISELLPRMMPELMATLPQLGQIEDLENELINPAAKALANTLTNTTMAKTKSPQELVKTAVAETSAGAAVGGYGARLPITGEIEDE
jgi:hypothetical protein